MQTLSEFLINYCEENKKEMPFGRHRDSISMRIINEVKAINKYETVRKKKETIEVNNYPNSLLPIVNSVVDEYFTNRNLFIRNGQKCVEKKLKRFNYDIPEHKATAFEEALKKCRMEVKLNKKSHGAAQYCVDNVGAANLINLGKAFQKERFFQEKRERYQKYQEKLKQEAK